MKYRETSLQISKMEERHKCGDYDLSHDLADLYTCAAVCLSVSKLTLYLIVCIMLMKSKYFVISKVNILVSTQLLTFNLQS